MSNETVSMRSPAVRVHVVSADGATAKNVPLSMAAEKTKPSL